MLYLGEMYTEVPCCKGIVGYGKWDLEAGTNTVYHSNGDQSIKSAPLPEVGEGCCSIVEHLIPTQKTVGEIPDISIEKHQINHVKSPWTAAPSKSKEC